MTAAKFSERASPSHRREDLLAFLCVLVLGDQALVEQALDLREPALRRSRRRGGGCGDRIGVVDVRGLLTKRTLRYKPKN